jgi:hypothetical protein
MNCSEIIKLTMIPKIWNAESSDEILTVSQKNEKEIFPKECSSLQIEILV